MGREGRGSGHSQGNSLAADGECPSPITPSSPSTVLRATLSGQCPGPPPRHSLGSAGTGLPMPGAGLSLAPTFCYPRLSVALERESRPQTAVRDPLPGTLSCPWYPGHGSDPGSQEEGEGRRGLPVLQGELGQLPVVVEPLELQRPAALGHAREHQAVSLQVHLRPHRLCLEIGGHVICGKQTQATVIFAHLYSVTYLES